MPTCEILGLVDRLYAAAAGNGLWTEAVAATVASLGGERGGLVLQDLAGSAQHETTLVGIAPEFQRSYRPLVTAVDMQPVWRRLTRLLPARGIVDESVGAGPDFDCTAFNHEWLRPQRIDHYAMVLMAPVPSLVAFLVVARSTDGGGFGADTIASIEMLRPHLSRAIQLRGRLDGAVRERHSALAALDRIDRGMLLLDPRGRIRHANKLAEAILRNADGLLAEAGRLTCEHPEDAAALRRGISVAAAMSREPPAAALAVRRRSGRRPLSLLVAPLRGRPDWTSASSACCVIVADAERTPSIRPAELRRLYGLTAAEARVALAPPDCDRLSDVAARLSVSLSTVRTLLQRAFAKTDTHRQAELVRLMMAHRLPNAAAAAVDPVAATSSRH